MAVRFMGMPLLKALWRTCRIRVEGLAHFDRVTDARVLICLWHEHLLLMPHFVSTIAPGHSYCAVISHSRDGQLIRKAALGMVNICFLTVPHDRKAHILRSITCAVDKGQIILITPDGPRGPPRKIKPSLTALARIAKAKVLPLSWTASEVWRLPTWDKMALPRPFSQVIIRIGPLVEVGTASPEVAIETVQRCMNCSGGN